MTDRFEMDSVVFEGRFLNVKSHHTFAWTYNKTFETRATIFMNVHMIQKLTKEEFETGIFLHELAHVACVKCKLFDCNHKKNCKRDDPECPDYFCQSFHHTGLWHQISEAIDSQLGPDSPKTSNNYTSWHWSNGLKKGITTIQIIHWGEKHEGRQDLKNCIYCRYYAETQQNVEEDLRSWEETSDESSEESEDIIEDSDPDYEPEVKTKKRKN